MEEIRCDVCKKVLPLGQAISFSFEGYRWDLCRDHIGPAHKLVKMLIEEFPEFLKRMEAGEEEVLEKVRKIEEEGKREMEMEARLSTVKTYSGPLKKLQIPIVQMET
ncbi:hypothetical protein [Candidatus Hecatella orcuttiae]|jgi:hypothetical protein|uniref:hypothetical protein n=1 Tax=Candidatus Hecatella orcuttiae TaxID=1935119 RepID=UPI0028683954|nr:hypothetical protein [Candidatus Hecatella orcuttiae]